MPADLFLSVEPLLFNSNHRFSPLMKNAVFAHNLFFYNGLCQSI